MHNLHAKNTVRYYLLLAFLVIFLFFSNDFGLTDVQKTAIVVAVGIDKDEEDFVLTSQIAIPQSSKQNQASEVVQLVSRGKTIGEAFEEINTKTGWYPKLVFCNLIILGESATKENVFDALDFFLRDEYLTDNCLVATCDGLAKEILDTTSLVEQSSSTAIQKVLSEHAKRVGTVLPNTLKDFSIGHFSDSKSAYLPILKKEAQQEPTTDVSPTASSGGESNSSGGQENGSGGKNAEKEKPVFSAGETALFVDGKWVERLQTEETFALGAVLNPLRLASYSVEQEGDTCTLTIKQNSPKISLKASEKFPFTLEISVTMTAGILDFSKAQPLHEISDAGDVPSGYFALAEKKLEGEIATVFEKCKGVECDLFGVRERLVKYAKKKWENLQSTALQNTRAEINVHFRNIR